MKEATDAVRLAGEKLWKAACIRFPDWPFAYFTDPVEFCAVVLGSFLTSDQERVARSFAQYRNLAVPSGHGVGKDWLAARLALWRLYATRQRAKVITTANTEAQLKLVLWGEIDSAIRQAPVELPGQMNVLSLTIKRDHYLVGLTAAKSASLQGHHAPEVTVIYDEADGIKPEFFAAGQSLSVGENDKQLAIFNPIDPSSEMARRMQSGVWHVERISSETHPNVKAGKTLIPGAVTRTYIDEILAETGGNRDSDLYNSRVRGYYPQQSEDSLISAVWIDAAKCRYRMPKEYTSIGCDVARYGPDKTVIAGIDEEGNVAILSSAQGHETMTTTGKLMSLARQFPNATITVDEGVMGGGVIDRLREQGIQVKPFNFGASAINPKTFILARDELYWTLREHLRVGDIGLPKHIELESEMVAMRYGYHSTGRVKVESKDALRDRLKRSPDHADAVALAVWGWRKRGPSYATGTVPFAR